VSHIKLVPNFSDISSTAFFGPFGCGVEGRPKLSKISHSSQIVVLTEANIEIQSRFFIDSLQKSSIGVSALFEISIGILPISIS
jgi:hypothetical protein